MCAMMGRSVMLRLYVVTLLMLHTAVAFDLLQYHKNSFEKTFHDRCDKYPFVGQYINKLEHSDERYFVFVYQENGLKNGGLGDKLGGLVSAAAMALRFNRTLILRSNNDMHEVFRPYHPTDIHNPTPKYSWTNITSWSNFDPRYSNSDATEYDLYDCINNTGQKNSHCSMKDGDASTPHILYRSNRAYLCYYDNNKDSVAYQQMSNILGVNSSTDLYEVAGCLLRLALWPTNQLWDEVGKQIREFEGTLQASSVAAARRNRRQNRRRLSRTRRADMVPAGAAAAAASAIATDTQDVQQVVQVGMHFRCGDKSYIKRGGYDHMCVYNADETEETKKSMFPLGNPYDLGVCARRSLHTYLTGLMEGRSKAGMSMLTANVSALDITDAKEILSVAFIASDNLMSSLQMNSTLGMPHSIVSPQGCHIEMDPSKQCHMFTASQWFQLALSDVLVTQAGIPSSFSRYAGIYGLKPDPFRNGQDCDMPYSSLEYCRKGISNWFC
jgi:hypothetical protein